MLLLTSSVYAAVPKSPGASVSVSVTVASQVGPLQIVGLRPPDPSHGNFIALHFRNNSDKATADYLVKPFVIARDHTGPVWDHTNDHADIRPGYGIIAPGGEEWSRETSVVNLATVMMAAKDLRSTCLQITPVVMGVKFEDGSSWKLNDASFNLNPAKPAEDTAACNEASVPESDFADMDRIELGFARSSDPSKSQSFFRTTSPEGVRSFAFSCYLRRIDDAHVALRCEK